VIHLVLYDIVYLILIDLTNSIILKKNDDLFFYFLGFIVNRLLVPYLAQAMAMVDRKVASVPDIDVSMQLGAGK
jgi:3-hydroxyacyl-CoA dehydrogenase